jgi:hypothetical protein
MQRLAISFLLAALTVPVQSPAADWPRFRGPNGTGVAETSALPDSIGPDRHVVWKTALPPGHSSPVISGDHVFFYGVRRRQALNARAGSRAAEESCGVANLRAKFTSLHSRNCCMTARARHYDPGVPYKKRLYILPCGESPCPSRFEITFDLL